MYNDKSGGGNAERTTFETRNRKKRIAYGAAIILLGIVCLFFIGLIVWGSFHLYRHYVTDVHDKRESDEYLRKLVRQVKRRFLQKGGRDGCRPYSFDLSCGVPCSPATFKEAEDKRTCMRRCQNIYYQNRYEEDKHFASFAYSMYPRSMTVSADGKERVKVPTVVGHFNEKTGTTLNTTEYRNIIKKEILLYGPTTMAFPVPEEFLHYSSGVFRPHPLDGFDDRIVYWHVVRLIGWGESDDGKHYWLAVNSFGAHWGDNGLFKINTDDMEKYGLEYETAVV
ncbi:unnamed protein product [Caenorhabditis angaria]|uniref:Peptidase C1A papain C-terminal domain-containing protein n=1 Tax=Caenorhabditis angaria TaxID=860376 RepID=A0A9P1I7K4_9PELO|nr:unnamed protein product [Caenorhabditis angaria]